MPEPQTHTGRSRTDPAAGISHDEAAGLDLGPVGDWMRSIGQPVDGALRPKRIGLGQSNLTYLVTDDGGHRWVLRRPPLGQLLASAHDVGREARILRALENTDVPVPRIFGVTEDPAVTDAPLVLMEYVDGMAVDRMSVAETLTPQRRQAIGLSMPAVLARIHAVDLTERGLDDLASHNAYAVRQVKRWAGQWEKSKTRDLPALDALTRRLSQAAPRQTEVTLVHGDFHLRNVLVTQQPAKAVPDACGEVVATLDWELSTLGDPLGDIGTLLAYWPESGETFGGDFTATALEGSPTRAQIVAEYLRLTGRDEAQLRYWQVLGLWKVAVIAEGVMRRAMDEPRNKAAAGTPTTGRIDALVDKATEIADAAGI
jgi:aminoglycoside phosphotransferase (APT) family kinase protein